MDNAALQQQQDEKDEADIEQVKKVEDDSNADAAKVDEITSQDQQ